MKLLYPIKKMCYGSKVLVIYFKNVYDYLKHFERTEAMSKFRFIDQRCKAKLLKLWNSCKTIRGAVNSIGP